MPEVHVGPTPPDPKALTIHAKREKLQSTAAKVGVGMAALVGLWVSWRWAVTFVVLLFMFSWIRKAGQLGNELKALVEK